MSFSHDVKNELCQGRPALCCKYAECYGMLLFGRSFQKDDISFLTASKDVALHLAELIKSCFDITVLLSEGGVKKPTYLLSVTGEMDIKRILLKYERYGTNAFLGINYDILKKECCVEAFLRGVFLSCGSVSDPNKSFHAEFAIKNSALSGDLFTILTERGLSPRYTERQGKSVIYFKNGADIEDLLTAIGATMHSLEIMNVQILKDIRNKTNRIKNCDNGNISRNIEASLAQCAAIEKLKSADKLSTLPPELYEVAVLRLEHPNHSLSELCKLMNNKITRSGMNHRIKKLLELAER